MSRTASDDTLDIAVIGDGAAVTEAARALATDAAGLRWRVFTADPGVAVPAGRLDGRQVSSALAMGSHIALLVGADMITARTVIVAASVPPPIAGERALRGHGVSYCAECDGSLARGRRVAAFVDTPALAHELAHLSGSARLEVIGVGADHPGPVVAVAGEGHVERVRLADGTELETDFLFLLTPRVPGPVLVPGVAADEDDRILVDEAGRTSIRGAFATGPIAARPDGAPAPDAARAVAAAVQQLTSPSLP